MSNSNKTLIIILNWNGEKDTIACLSSLKNLISGALFDVFLLDNFSKSTGLLDEYMSSNYILNSNNYNFERDFCILSARVYSFGDVVNSRLIYLKSNVNHGFAKGCNIGALFANKYDYKNILFLNNDTVVEPDFLDFMLSSLKDSSGVIPQIRYFSDKNIIWNCGGQLSMYGKRKYNFAGKNSQGLTALTSSFDVTFATGCCLLFPTKLFFEIGLFNEGFFFGEEDIDLCLRLRKKKIRLICNPSAIIYHKVGASITGDPIRLQRKAYIHYLNRFVNMKKHLGCVWYLWLVPSSLKVLVNVSRINKLPLSKTLYFVFKLLKDSLTLNEVSRNKFESVLEDGY